MEVGFRQSQWVFEIIYSLHNFTSTLSLTNLIYINFQFLDVYKDCARFSWNFIGILSMIMTNRKNIFKFFFNFKLLLHNRSFLTYFYILSFCFIWKLLVLCMGFCSRYKDLCPLKLFSLYFVISIWISGCFPYYL